MSKPVLNRLLFAGEAIVDVVMRVPALPPRGGDVLAESSEVTAGGGFNVMAAAARLGISVRELRDPAAHEEAAQLFGRIWVERPMIAAGRLSTRRMPPTTSGPR